MRNRRGQSLMELGCGLIVAIPIMLALLDAGVILIGAAAADNLCRDAARAAASGPPGTLLTGQRTVDNSGEPVKRAKAVIKRIYSLGIPVKVRENELEVTESLQGPLPSTSYGGSINGNVVVSCTVDVCPPFIIGVVHQTAIPMKSRHSYPYTYVLPPTIAAEP
jgi:hypothetical protein